MSYRDVHEVHMKDSHGERRLLVKKDGFVSILSVFLADRVRTLFRHLDIEVALRIVPQVRDLVELVLDDDVVEPSYGALD